MLSNCAYYKNITEDYEPVYDIAELAVEISINFAGTILNLINVLIYSRAEFRSSSIQFSLFKYILFKSAVDFAQHLNNLVTYIIAAVYKYESIKLVVLQIYYVAIGVLSTTSDAIEIVQTIALLLSISEVHSDSVILSVLRVVFVRLGFYGWIGVIVSSAVIISIPRMFQIMYFNECAYLPSDFFRFWFPEATLYTLLVSSIIRDLLFPIFLTLANIALLTQYKKSMKRKKSMAKSNNTTATTHSDITIMILFIGLKSLICHMPILISRFYFIFPVLSLNRVYSILDLALFQFSYVLNFFIYFAFNRKFRSTFVFLFSCCCKKVSSLYNISNS